MGGIGLVILRPKLGLECIQVRLLKACLESRSRSLGLGL